MGQELCFGGCIVGKTGSKVRPNLCHVICMYVIMVSCATTELQLGPTLEIAVYTGYLPALR